MRRTFNLIRFDSLPISGHGTIPPPLKKFAQKSNLFSQICVRDRWFLNIKRLFMLQSPEARSASTQRNLLTYSPVIDMIKISGHIRIFQLATVTRPISLDKCYWHASWSYVIKGVHSSGVRRSAQSRTTSKPGRRARSDKELLLIIRWAAPDSLPRSIELFWKVNFAPSREVRPHYAWTHFCRADHIPLCLPDLNLKSNRTKFVIYWLNISILLVVSVPLSFAPRRPGPQTIELDDR